MALQNLPIGIQSFEKLRSNNYLYIDKTEDIYRMISLGNPCFLSRPRRFGKSLLVSALDCLFSGRKDLFEGLYICDKWDWTRKNPVLRFDFGGMSYRKPELLEQSLDDVLNNYISQYEIVVAENSLGRKFQNVLTKLHEKTGEKVVVLIDEYDKAIIDNLKDPSLADEIRKMLHDFYQILKAADDHLRFVFLTGVSKFSKISIFSGLNNLMDITLDNRFSTICGITQQQLETQFAPYIDDMAQSENVSTSEVLDKIKYWYNGYSWDGENPVYNPFSTLQFFSRKQFIDYWFESGSPTFLIDLIKQRNDINTVLEAFEISGDAFSAFDINTLNTTLLMFQTGYLTIKSTRKIIFGNLPVYLLSIPNNEVRNGLMRYLLAAYANTFVTDVAVESNKMMEQLLNGDSIAFDTSLKRLLSHIPYQLHIPHEAYYHSLMLLWLNLLGFTVEAEIPTNTGRIDAVWTWQERVVIAEVKYAKKGNPEKLIDEAFVQIHEKKYYERYAGENKRIALLAVVFTGREVKSKMFELTVAGL